MDDMAILMEAGEKYHNGERQRLEALRQLREVVPRLLRKGVNMVKIADMLGIKRPTLYYQLWTKYGTPVPTHSSHEVDLQLYDGEERDVA